MLKLLRGRLDDLAQLIDANPALVNRRFSELDCGMSGGRSLTLQGGTLLHVAAEYGNLAALALLLGRGADVNARATVDDAGVGGQTAIFHAVSQFDDHGLPVTQLLIARGADLALRAKLPGDYERPGEIVECTIRTATGFSGLSVEIVSDAARRAGRRAVTSFSQSIRTLEFSRDPDDYGWRGTK